MPGESATQFAPLRVGDATELNWTDEADIVVVGFGGAGASAAVQASDDGACVIAVERFDGGGSTAISGGVMYAGGTRYQHEAGFNDTPEEMFKYLSAETTAVSPRTLRRFCDESNANLEWLGSFGVPHGSSAFLEKASFPPDGYWLYYSGNEKVPAYAAVAKPAPRGHRVVTPRMGGHVRFAKLKAAALARGVKVIPHAPVTRLVVDALGRVIGVEANALPRDLWRRHQKLHDANSPLVPFNGPSAERAMKKAEALERGVHRPIFIRARAGVLLSAGGFIQNREMLHRYKPVLGEKFSNLVRLATIGDDGRGIELGGAAGGQFRLMDKFCASQTIVPPASFAHGLLVNAKGQRFVNEVAYLTVVGGAVLEQPEGGKAYLILRGREFWKALHESLFPGKGRFLIWGVPALINIFFGGTRRAATLAGLARKIGIDARGLGRTVAVFNDTAARGGSDALGKAREFLKPLVDGPFYAVNMSIDNNFVACQIFTTGGLDVDEDTGAVKRADGGIVEGLYAAGRNAYGVCSDGLVSGLSIADVVFSGRRAGRAMASSRKRLTAA